MRRKLGICCNFGPPHIGGSELVIENIGKRLVDQYDYDVTIYGYNYDRNSTYKGMKIEKCAQGDGFISQIAQNDHIFVYSDSFWGFDTLMGGMDRIDCTASVALVGAYHMQSNPPVWDLFKKHEDRFTMITHGRGPDHTWASRKGILTTIIPNGYDRSEFENNTINFREKYNIKEKYILLNVSNYFFGKGQEVLVEIGKKMRDDCIIIQLSNSVKYPYDKRFLERCQRSGRNVNIRFLRDLPREDVISAFLKSHMFVFTSKKEVSPLVILESRAAKLPWVSMEVGDINYQSGGVVVHHKEKNLKDYIVVDETIVDQYVNIINRSIDSTVLGKNLVSYSERTIDNFNWDNIVPLYHEVFSG